MSPVLGVDIMNVTLIEAYLNGILWNYAVFCCLNGAAPDF